MDQIAGELKNRQKTSLASNTEAQRNAGNSGKKQYQTVTLRSGKPMTKLRRLGKKTSMTQTTDISNDQLHSQPTTDSPTDLTEEHTNSTPQKQVNAQRTQSGKSASTSAPTELQTSPYPQRLRNKKNDEGKFWCFLDMLRQLHINIPLLEVLEKMPSYVKFFKDILSKKRRIGEFETMALTQECSAMV